MNISFMKFLSNRIGEETVKKLGNAGRFRRMAAIAIILCMVVTFSGCANTAKPTASFILPNDTLFQISTLTALMQGYYDGAINCGELKKHGDAGVGTFDAVDGEMVVLDGKVYQVKADGSSTIVGDDVTTPFAAVTFFEEDAKQTLKNIDTFDNLKKQLDSMITNPNIFYTFRIDATFKYVKTRSVPKQSKPYALLTEVLKNQPIFEFHDVKGTLVGFWCPQYVNGINLPGYHLHFLTDDRLKGGHLLECSLTEGTVTIDYTNDFYMALPTANDFAKVNLNVDTTAATKKVESK